MKLLTFKHLYKTAPWGGETVRSFFGRGDTPAVCSESWEISGHPSSPSIVASGEFAGRTLDALTAELGSDLVGTNSPTKDRFPLLFKLIDAKWPLSLQVHPNEQTAKLTGGEPKTEAWLVVDTKPGAVLYAGLKRAYTPDELRAIVGNGAVLLDQINPLRVTGGDILYIPGGLIHAIGGGTLIYEVQQSSNTTYRFYDWDRVSADGKKRPLHVEASLKSINYDLQPSEIVKSGELKTPFFHTRVLPLDEPLTLSPDGSSFIAGFVLSGATREVAFGESFLLAAKGEPTAFTPAQPNTKLIVTTID